MARSSVLKVVSLRKDDAVGNRNGASADAAREPHRLEEPRRFPIVTTLPRLPVMIPDEILDYYG